jgi:hypothetical protein
MTTTVEANKTTTIRQLNDQFRKTLVGGRIVLTCGVREKGEETVKQLLVLLCSYDDFTEDNDPYAERDFGQLIYEKTKYFFKIDYYDIRMLMHSPDAADPKVTCRVLTIMLASEY